MQPPDQISADIFVKDVLEIVSRGQLVVRDGGQYSDVKFIEVQILPLHVCAVRITGA
jgi:hypothetical protein